MGQVNRGHSETRREKGGVGEREEGRGGIREREEGRGRGKREGGRRRGGTAREGLKIWQHCAPAMSQRRTHPTRTLGLVSL